MTDDTHTLLILSIFVGIILAVMSKNGVKIILTAFVLLMTMVKWAIIIGLVWGLVNTDAFYRCVGFTPISAMIDMFEDDPNAGARFHEPKPVKKQTKQRNTNGRNKASKVQETLSVGRH